MDAISYSYADKQAKRIKKFINNPDSNSGIVTVPKVIEAGESVTVPAGRVAVLPNVQVDGTLNVEGEVFIPAGTTFGDLEGQISTKLTKQAENITVNVGPGGEYATINEALEYLSGFYPLHKTTGVTATINLKAGFVMAEQVLVRGLNLGWITIVGEDAETIINHTALTTALNVTNYPAFGVDNGGTSPVIGQLFRFNVEKVGGNKHGLMTFGAGSSANLLYNTGFIGAGSYGIYASSCSTIDARAVFATNAGTYGIFAELGSTINAANVLATNAGSIGILAVYNAKVDAAGSNASNAVNYGVYADNCSTIDITGATIQNQTTGSSRIRVNYGSHIVASGINTSGGTVPALSQTANTLTGSGIIYQ